MTTWGDMLRRCQRVNEALGLRPEDFPDPSKGEGYVGTPRIHVGWDFGVDLGTVTTEFDPEDEP